VSSASRREFRTGSRRALSAGSSSHERFIIIAGIALLAVALLIAITRREPTPAVVPPAAPQEARVVTVPVPMPVEPPAPQPPPPAPIKPPVVHRAPAPVTIAAPAAPPPEAHGPPSASELVALYRSVGQTLDRVRDDALWQRYRWIRLADYLVTPEKRAEAARMLDAIASDARGK
jgi:hypothetical protein